LVLASALAMVSCVATATAAGAAGKGTSCSSFSGSATFTPPLPGLSKTNKVNTTLKGTGTLSGCNGKVTSAKVTLVAKISGTNCLTLGNPSKTAIKVTETITWTPKATSGVAMQLTEVKNRPVTYQKITGAVSKGQFKGLHESGALTYKTPSGACKNGQPLRKITFTGVVPTVFK
jgi:hypothetical protein